jgi:3-phenylpropionate/trans-cinnamate dioxygenase ferredoxin reductase subunit
MTVMGSPNVVIVGASLAGATVAKTLRAEGFDGTVTLVGEERHPPYERPPLSKGVLRGEQQIEDAHVEHLPFYEEAGIDLRTGVRAERVDGPTRTLHLSTGEVVPFETLVLTTGGRPRRPRIPGVELEGIHVLRTADDAMRLREDVAASHAVVVVGMGFIGSEVAASLRQVGVEVTAIEPATTPLEGPLGADVGRLVERMHRDRGVRLVLGDAVERFEGRRRIEGVVTRRGRRIPADLVVMGLGMEPNVALVAGTPIRVDDGVVVDAFGRTSVGGVYAAGDVANHWHPTARRHLRVEHWTNAVKQGAAVARNILGREQPYDPVHFFWSEQYDRELQYYGLHEPWDDLVVRGSLDDGEFLAVYTSERRVVAAVAIDRSDELQKAKGLIASRAVVSDATLRDEDVDLRSLAPPRSGIAA